MGFGEKLAKGMGIAGAAFTGITVAVNLLESKKDININHKQGFYEKYIKRPQDLVCATAATVLLSPVMAGTALAVKLKLGSPVLFTQERPGLNEEIFKLYKFRTMTDERDENGELLPDEDRLTKFGAFLRTTSLDELPEMLNIIKGDMSVVGPRPLLVRYLPYYHENERARHSVRPGLTGQAQISGRNNSCWDERLEIDVKYAENISFFTDLIILIKTVKKVLAREDVVDDGKYQFMDLDLERENSVKD